MRKAKHKIRRLQASKSDEKGARFVTAERNNVARFILQEDYKRIQPHIRIGQLHVLVDCNDP
jgi:hypothetical protein